MSQSLRERLEVARRRIKQAEGDAEPPPACNYLFLSDVHLGEYIKEHARIEFLKRNAQQDRDLCDLLEYYASHTVDDKPWRLVIGGDFLDFLTVTVTPSQSATAHHPELQIDEEEEVFGLDTDEDKAVWKLERIIDRHSVLFAYLADFVGRGHHLDMLYGNHDAEFYWPRAKQTFVKLLTDIYFGSERIPGASEASFARRIQWHEWFYIEKGKFYVEHGNQYDDFSSFRYRLNPVVPFKPRDLDMPASHMIIRYFVNRLNGFRTHNKDNWTFWDFISWTFSQGWSRSRFIVSAYVGVTRRLLRYAKIVRFADSAELERTHLSRRGEEAERYGLEPDVVEAIDNRRHPPVHESWGGIVQGMTLDQQAQMLIYAILFIVILFLPGWTVKVVALSVWAGLMVLRKPILKFVRNHFLGGEITSVITPSSTTQRSIWPTSSTCATSSLATPTTRRCARSKRARAVVPQHRLLAASKVQRAPRGRLPLTPHLRRPAQSERPRSQAAALVPTKQPPRAVSSPPCGRSRRTRANGAQNGRVRRARRGLLACRSQAKTPSFDALPSFSTIRTAVFEKAALLIYDGLVPSADQVESDNDCGTGETDADRAEHDAVNFGG